MEITVSDGRFDAYVATAAVSPAPVVIVLHEIFGVNADIRATCDELASQGFTAVAPQLFWRDERGLDLNSWSEADWAHGMRLYRAFDLDRGVGDVATAVAQVRAMPGSTGRAGVMGFCLGGLMAYLTSARSPVDAAVSYYGGSTEHHLGEAAGLTTPLLMHLGEEDEFISKPAQQQIKLAFGEKSNVQIHSYSGCSHAFARHTGTHYDAAAAALANERTYAFLWRNLIDA